MNTLTLMPAPARAAAEPSPLLAAVLDEIDTGVLVCDERGGVQFGNAAARSELVDGRLLHLEGGHTLRACGDGLGAALSGACRRGRHQVLALERGGLSLHLAVSPLAGATTPLALVMLGRRAPCSLLALELMGIARGLTVAERRVLAHLLAQRSPRQIAVEHGVALSTVRTQILALRTKLGVRSLQSLLCLAAGLPPMALALRGAAHGAVAARIGLAA